MPFIKTGLECPKCTSSDAFAIDDNGWGKCFSCWINIPVDDNAQYERQEVKTNKGIIVKHTLQIKAIPERKLTLETAKTYGVGYKDDDVYFPLNNGDAYKVRVGGEKRFRIEGDFNNTTTLFGQDKFVEGGKRIVVVEGEYDAMALHQILGKYNVPVVSVRNGAQSALRDVKANYDYLNTFEDVIFFFDNDEPGNKAVEQCAEVMSHKAKVVKGLGEFKDPCDYLMANKSAEAMKAFWNAQKWTPDGIVNGSTLYDEVMKPMAKADCYYPFDGLNELTFGIRKGELVTVTAGSGLGKSQFLREIVYHLLQSTDENIGLMFMEESIQKTALSIMSLAANKPLHIPTTEATQDEKDKAFKQTMGTDRLFMFEHFGSTSIDNIISRTRYLSKATDCKYIFLDHVSIIVSSQENGDERKAIDEIMTKLRTLVQETGISLIIVSHLKRPDKKGHEEGATTSLAQLRGSASIAQLSDIVLGLERNGQADDKEERNTTHVRVLKNRFAGITGKACALLYDLDTGRMTETIEDDAL